MTNMEARAEIDDHETLIGKLGPTLGHVSRILLSRWGERDCSYYLRNLTKQVHLNGQHFPDGSADILAKLDALHA